MQSGLELARACARRMYDADPASRGLGMELEVPAPGEAVTRLTIRPDMVNGHDICHGGFIFTLADSAFAFACNAYDEVNVAAAASVEFLAPGRLGDRLEAHARERSRGRRSGVYDVEVRNQDGRVLALFRGRSAALGRPVLDASSSLK